MWYVLRETVCNIYCTLYAHHCSVVSFERREEGGEEREKEIMNIVSSFYRCKLNKCFTASLFLGDFLFNRHWVLELVLDGNKLCKRYTISYLHLIYLQV